MAQIVLDSERFVTLLIGAVSVIAGVHLENGLMQAGEATERTDMAAKTLFFGGWAVVAYALAMRPDGGAMVSLDNQKGLIGIAGAGAVVFAVMNIMKARKAGNQPDRMYGMMFIGGWVAVGYAAGLAGVGFGSWDTRKLTWAGLGVAGVFASMLYILPERERPLQITDGIAMPLFALGWVSVALANAMI